nr:unnamed protein product [Callosobruchus analis]
MTKLKNKALLKFKRTKLQAHWEYYKSLRNLLKTAIDNEKKAFLQFTSKNSNKWKLYKDLQVYSKSTLQQIPDELGDTDLINSHFLNENQSLLDPDLEIMSLDLPMCCFMVGNN